MGGGNWSDPAYQAARTARRATGASAFTHTTNIASGAAAAGVHETLDPLADGSLVTREARDSDDHPASTPIAVIFDETGSMGEVPKMLVEKLDGLHGLVARKGYVTDPQICFGAVGDGRLYEKAPFQIGQFESDNRMADQLGLIYLEGQGGGNGGESYGLIARFFDTQVVTDAWEKRGQKGYLFIVGDEPYFDQVDAKELAYLGIDEEPQSTADLFNRVQERWHVFFIHPVEGSYQDGAARMGWQMNAGDGYTSRPWRALLGERYISGTTTEAVCETIALAIGMTEGTIDLDQGLADMDEIGSGALTSTVSTALAPLSSTTSGVVATSEAPSGLTMTEGGGADRL